MTNSQIYRLAQQHGARIMTTPEGHEMLCFPPGAILTFTREATSPTSQEYVDHCWRRERGYPVAMGSGS